MFLKALSISVVTLFISGCGGGGGGSGSSSSSASISQFIKYSEVAAETPITFTNVQTQEVSYTYDEDTEVLTSIGTEPRVAFSGSLTEKYDELGGLISMAFTSSEGTSLIYGDDEGDGLFQALISIMKTNLSSIYLST